MENVSKIIAYSFKNKNINVSFSAGISHYEKGKTLDDAIKEADIALYEAKEKGKCGVTCYNPKVKKLK